MRHSDIVGQNLRRMANDTGKTQADICHDLGVRKSTVSSWFTGERMPRMDKVDMLCDYFGASRADILDPHSNPGDVTSMAEEDFIRRYRRLNAHNKKIVCAVLAALEGLQKGDR